MTIFFYSQKYFALLRKEPLDVINETDQNGQTTGTLLLPAPSTPPTGSSYATTTFFDNGSLNGTSSLAPPASPGVSLGRHNSIVVLQQPNGDGQSLGKGVC